MRNQPISFQPDEGEFTIPEGMPIADSFSPFIDLRRKMLRGFTIFSPPALTGTVNVQVTGNLANSELTVPIPVDWVDLQSGGANIVVGAAEAVPIDFTCWDAIRIKSDSVETEKREFILKGVEDLT